MLIAHRSGMTVKSGWVNPYVTDGLCYMFLGRDFDGSKIDSVIGGIPPLVLDSSSTGIVVKTSTGIKASGGSVVLTTETVPSVVSVFDSWANGNGGEVSFENCSDFTGTTGYASTTSNLPTQVFATNDTVAVTLNPDWCQSIFKHTINTTQGVSAFSASASFGAANLAMTSLPLLPESAGIYMAKDETIEVRRRLFGYTESYETSGQISFYNRSYSSSARSRFITESFLKCVIQDGVEFNRAACWLKKLNDTEIAQNQNADMSEFGFAA